MKTLIFLGLSLYVSLSFAQAQDALNTKFDQVVNAGLSGKAISFEEFKGAYVGRCYRKSTPNQATSSATLTTELESKDGSLEKVSIAGIYPNSVDKFDSWSEETITMHLLTLKSMHKVVNENPLVVGFKGKLSAHFKYTQFENNIFLMGEALSNSQINDLNGKPEKILKGEIWIACYYFEKKE